MMDFCENSSRFVKLYDIDSNGNYLFIPMIGVELRKECPNCYVVFLRRENLCSIRKANQNESSRVYKCPSCCCRIKTYEYWYKILCFLRIVLICRGKWNLRILIMNQRRKKILDFSGLWEDHVLNSFIESDDATPIAERNNWISKYSYKRRWL